MVDEKVYKYTDTNAMRDTKQILCNPLKNNFTVYINEFTDVTRRQVGEDEYDYYYDYDYDYTNVYGSLTFRVDGNKILTENKFISKKMASPNGRCTFIGDTIYMVDEYADIDCTAY